MSTRLIPTFDPHYWQGHEEKLATFNTYVQDFTALNNAAFNPAAKEHMREHMNRICINIIKPDRRMLIFNISAAFADNNNELIRDATMDVLVTRLANDQLTQDSWVEEVAFHILTAIPHEAVRGNMLLTLLLSYAQAHNYTYFQETYLALQKFAHINNSNIAQILSLPTSIAYAESEKIITKLGDAGEKIEKIIVTDAQEHSSLHRKIVYSKIEKS